MSLLFNLIETYGLIGLFINIFLSYSVLPTFTEVPIVLSINFFSAWDVFLVAMVASTLGSVTNYYIGLKGVRKFMPESKRFKRAEKLFDKFGPLGLVFLTWLPFIGDPIIIVAGALEMNFWKFLLYSTLAKVWYLGLIVFFGHLIF